MLLNAEIYTTYYNGTFTQRATKCLGKLSHILLALAIFLVYLHENFKQFRLKFKKDKAKSPNYEKKSSTHKEKKKKLTTVSMFSR